MGFTTTSVHPIFPRPGVLRADPFPIRMNDADWILFEEQLPGDRGRLRAARLDPNGWNVLDGQLLDLPHHLSWPCPVEIEGRLHLLPETGEANEVALWECEGFPFRWKKVRILLEGRHWHDPSLVKIGDIWWLFVSAGGDYDQDHSSEFHAFWSPSPLETPFTAHELNPLSLTVAGSRPAGTPFMHEGSLLRPVQDCRAGYGTGVLIRKLEELTPSTWRETTIGRIDPPQGAAGIHTLNHLPGLGWIVDTI